MTLTERIKVMSLQGMPNCDIARELNRTRQQISAALHGRPAMFKQGRKALPLECCTCGVALTDGNKEKNHRRCKPCARAYAKELKSRNIY